MTAIAKCASSSLNIAAKISLKILPFCSLAAYDRTKLQTTKLVTKYDLIILEKNVSPQQIIFGLINTLHTSNIRNPSAISMT